MKARVPRLVDLEAEDPNANPALTLSLSLTQCPAWKTSKPRSCTAHASAATRASLAPSQSEVSSEVSVAARRGAAPTALGIAAAAGDGAHPSGDAAC